MTCVLLGSPAASVADAEFVAEITDFVLSRKTFVWCFACKNNCPVSNNDGRKADCSETSFHSSPAKQRLRNACSRENATNKFRVIFTPPTFPRAISRDDFLLDNLAIGNLEGGTVSAPNMELCPEAYCYILLSCCSLYAYSAVSLRKSVVDPEVQEQLSATQCYGDWTHH